MKKYAYACAAIAVLIALAVILRAGEVVAPSPEPALAPAPVAQPIAESVPQPEDPPPTPEPLASDPTPIERTVSVMPQPYFPPPTLDLSGGTLGRQRVPLPDAMGDVYQAYFHRPTLALFMAVVEPSGLRSIWRLNEHGVAERVFATNDLPGEIRIFGDSRGVIYVAHDNPARMYRTADAFKTWYKVFERAGIFWQMADDGYGTVYGTLHGWNEAILYRSPDDGFTWEPWKNFQEIMPKDAVTYADGDGRFRLRHLHDIIVNQRDGSIVVGTGDVARYALISKDGGETWKKLWDEGFTAHAVVSGGNRYLLCPDQLNGHGIAMYDAAAGTVKEVWNPIPYKYAGYCYSVVNVGGTYYAALHTEANEEAEVIPKSGIIVSRDAQTWYPFLEWGPLGNHARTNIWLAEGPNVVYASVNGVLYAFRPLDQAWFSDKTPFTR